MGRDRQNRKHQIRNLLDEFHGRRRLCPDLRPPVCAVRVRAGWTVLQNPGLCEAAGWTARDSRQCFATPHTPQAHVLRGSPSRRCKSGCSLRSRGPNV